MTSYNIQIVIRGSVVIEPFNPHRNKTNGAYNIIVIILINYSKVMTPIAFFAQILRTYFGLPISRKRD